MARLKVESRPTRLKATVVLTLTLPLAVGAGCAGTWNGPKPPVTDVPTAAYTSATGAGSLPTEELWVYKHKAFIGAAPAAIGPCLAVSDSKGKIAFVDPNSGELLDMASAKYPLERAPVWDTERFYVTTAYPRKRVIALRFSDGGRSWRQDFRHTPETPIFVNGELWVAAGDTLYALDPGKGDLLRSVSAGEERWLRPVCNGSTVLLVSDAGHVRNLDLSGRANWAVELDAPCAAVPIWVGSVAVVATTNGMLAAIESGAVRWVDTLDAEALYAPTVSGDAVIVTGKSGHVWSIDLATGHVGWKHSLGVPAAGGALVRDGWVAVTSVDGKLWFIDEAAGTVKYSHVFTALIHEPPVWAFGRLYVVTEDKRLHAFGTGADH